MGKLIVLDGLDGSGKTTQFDILRQRLDVVPISFPDYNSPSSALVKMYLSGELAPDAEGVNAYAASSFYAVDRYASCKMHWEKDYQRGKTILASRYTTSNAIHQMGKLPEDEWDEYLRWLADYEYGRLGLPEPDLVIFLDMPPEVSQGLMTVRYGGNEDKKDIHEADTGYLAHCRKSALYAAEKLGWRVVRCGGDGQAYSVEKISGELLQIIEPYL